MIRISLAFAASRVRLTAGAAMLGGLAAALVSCAPPAAHHAGPEVARPARSAPATETIDDVVTEALRRAMTPGAVIAVVQHDSLIFLKAYGRTGDESAPPLDVDALFQAGSVAELVNALAAARLAREGRVGLDAPVSGVVREVPNVLGRATLAQLLTHTAGLAVYPAVPGRGGADDLGAAARQLTPLDRVTDPGTMFSASPMGVALAGLVLERAARQPYAALMSALVLEPLGMTRTTYDFAAAQPQLTPGYRLSQSARAPFELVAANREPAVNMPIGGLYSTASDLARLAAALLNDGVVRGERVLPEGVAADVLTPRATLPASETRIGFGTQLMPWEGRPALRVMGGAAGYGVLLHLLTEDRVGVIVLTNKWGNTLSGVADFVFRTTLGLAEAPRATVTPAPVDSAVLAEVASYPGTYLNGSELIEIVVEGGRPRLKSDELVLELRTLPGGAVGVVLDAQIVMSFRLLKDAAGRPYLWIGQRALGRRQR